MRALAPHPAGPREPRGRTPSAGAQCTLGRGACASRHTALLLLSYVAVNFLFNTTGLWLTKHAGAVVNSISYALLLPLTTIAFSTPLLGRYREAPSAATYAGLGVTLLGFGLWRAFQLVVDAEEPPAEGPHAESSLEAWGAWLEKGGMPPGEEAPPPSRRAGAKEAPDSFQERIIGMGMAHRKKARPEST